MPLDAVFMKALTNELSDKILGLRIDKVTQPERDTIILSIRGAGGSYRLLLCAGSGNARLQITQSAHENPLSPPMFCMLLRKHIQGARISGIQQPEGERMAVLALDTRDEFGDETKKSLILEAMGRNSNIILVDGENRIVDSLRRVDSDMSSKRQLLPGLFYSLPPTPEKSGFFTASAGERKHLWESASPDLTAEKWMLDSFFGLSPLICRELCFRSFGDVSPRIESISADAKASFPLAMDALCDTVSNGDFTPVMLLDGKIPKDFSFMPIKQYGDKWETRREDEFSELLDNFYRERDKEQSIARKAGDMTKSIKTSRDRLKRKLGNQELELSKSIDREGLKQKADIIMANLYRLKKGDRSFLAENFYSDPPEEINIELDPLKTPQQNAANYYKGYNKAKTAQEHLTLQIAQGKASMEYLNSVLDTIERAESDRELGEIRTELIDAGFLRKSSKDKKKQKQKATEPMRFMSSGGVQILVGRNNSQNDTLTLKTALKNDVWLHAQKIHGSHVIISTGDGLPDDETLKEAASLAAYYSQSRDSGKVPIDYTLVKYVKKPRGSLPGMVIYTDQKTIMAEPDKGLAEKLKA